MSRCLSTGKPRNPDELDTTELVIVNCTTYYPHNYWLIEIGGTEISKAQETPVAPGTYNIIWMRTTFGDYSGKGKLRITLNPIENIELVYKMTKNSMKFLFGILRQAKLLVKK